MNIVERLEKAYEALFEDKKEAALEKANPPGAGDLPIARPVQREPISHDYKNSENTQLTPGAGETYSFKQLRSVADSCDIVRIAIQMRKEQFRGLRWDIVVRPEAKARAEELEPRRQKIKDFFRNPDKSNDYNFTDLMAAWLEDLLVIDAAALWVQKDRAGRLYSLTSVDGATIKPVITDRGFVPMPPLPAYAQIIQGTVYATFTREELIYCQYNPRSKSLYGMSPVEMVMTSAHISLRRQLHNLNYYTEGSVPDYLLVAPPEWSTEQIRQVQAYLDNYLSGDSSRRHKMKLVPSGIKPESMKQQDFTTAYEEWLTRIVGAAFNIAPHVLLRQRTKQQADALEDQQGELGLEPIKAYTSEMLTTRVIEALFGEYDLAFAWLSQKRETEEQNLARAQAMMPLGAVGIDEVRVSEGRAAIGVPPYIRLPNGVIFLTAGLVKRIAAGEIEFVAADGTGGKLIGPEEKLKAKQKATPQQQKAALVSMVSEELEKWEKFSLSALKKPVSRKFRCDWISASSAEKISSALEGCSTEDQVREVFRSVREGLDSLAEDV